MGSVTQRPYPDYTHSEKLNADIQAQMDSFTSSLADMTTDLIKRSLNVALPFGTGLTPAKGDGTTDDTTALNNLIDYANTNGYSVYIPKTSTNYRITNSIQFKAYTRIYSNGAVIMYEGTGTAVKAEGTSSGYIYPYMEGVTVDKKNRDKIGIGMSVQYSRMGGQFVDCKFYGFEHGVTHSDISVDNKWSWLNSFTRCQFRFNKYGVTCLSNTNGVTFDRCLFNNNELYGFKVGYANMVSVLNSEFEQNGQVTGGHGVVVDGARSFVLSGCYMEQNGFNDTDSAAIHIGGVTTSFIPKIINNYINGGTIHTIIKAVQCFDIFISGNDFYDTAPPSAYDIDISGMTVTNNTFIMGNRASSATGKINIPTLSNNAWIQHSNDFYKKSIKLTGDNTSITWSDNVNSSTHKMDLANNKLRIFDETGAQYVQFNGDTKQTRFAMESGTTALRPTGTALYAVGQPYFDTTLGKPIYLKQVSPAVWVDATGTTV